MDILYLLVPISVLLVFVIIGIFWWALQGGQVMDVVRTLQQARATMRTVRQNLVWAGVYNAVSVPMALVGWMPPWLAGLGMAASSLLVIGNALRLARSTGPDIPFNPGSIEAA